MVKTPETQIERLNNNALSVIDRYQHLRVGQAFVNTPFFINEIGLWFGELMKEANIDTDLIDEVFRLYKEKQMPYGWFRGKGSPEELEGAVVELSDRMGLDLSRATPESAAEFMKFLGLGIDCSGLVTNALTKACEEEGIPFLDSLDILENVDGQRTKYRAGVFSYINDEVSTVVEPKDIAPLDILIRKGWHDRAWHMGIILQREDYLVLSHSTLGLTPNGVHTSWFKVEDNRPVFGFKPNLSPVDWEEYYENGKMEFRRLKVFSDLKGREELSSIRNRGET